MAGHIASVYLLRPFVATDAGIEAHSRIVAVIIIVGVLFIVSIIPVFMSICWKKVAATQFSIYMALAEIPGAKARARGHPQADAISVLAWFGLLMGFAPWVAALVWAHTRPAEKE